MTTAQIIRSRLQNQQITGSDIRTPEAIVSWFAAMQAQDYGMAKWAIGLRLPGISGEEIEKSFNDGKIIRTHLLRPTWHFVEPADIRWLLELTGPGINAFNQYYYKQAGLNASTLKRTRKVIIKSLLGNNHLTRSTLQNDLKKAKITLDGLALSYVMMDAELEGIICSGPRHGKQFTYALVDEWVPLSKKKSKEDALVTLLLRYFKSRGPATLQDFCYWSWLKLPFAREGISNCGKQLITETIKGKEYFFTEAINLSSRMPATFLLPDYDEYIISYKNRDLFRTQHAIKESNAIKAAGFYHCLIVDGLIGGTWQKKQKGNKIQVEVKTEKGFNPAKQPAIDKAIERYLEFQSSAKDPKEKL